MDGDVSYDLNPVSINAMVAAQFPGSTALCRELGDNFAVAVLVADASNLRPGGFISGPTQFAVLDSAMWFASFVGLGRVEPMAMTSELSVRFLRPAQGAELWCKAVVETVTRRSVVMTAHVWTDANPAKYTATAQGTYAIPLPR